MIKRMLSVMLVITLAFGALAVTASAETDPNAVDYRVGYAKADINPYWSAWEAAGNAIPGQAKTSTGAAVTSDHIMPLPMGGYGGNVHRLSRPELIDDNGSGTHASGVVYLTSNRYTQAFAKEMLGDGTDAYKAYAAKGFGQNDGDGIYATCVSIRQNPTAEPILMFSVDLISVGETYIGQAKNVIIRELKKIGVDISPDRILINATHTHGAVSLGESFTAASTYKQKLYGNTTEIPFSGTELNSYLNCFRKYMYSQLAAAAVQALTDGQTNGSVVMEKGTIDVSDATGYQLNGVRHRKAQLTTTVDGVSKKVDYVTGSSFNVSLKNADGTKAKEVSAVSESNDKLHVLQFSFPDNSNVEPILVVNWRAHTTANNKMNSKAYNNLSADFVAAMRYKLEQWGYRFILNYSASGNLGMGDSAVTTYNISTSETATTMNATKYGYALAYAAAYLASGTSKSSVSSYRTSLLSALSSSFGTTYRNKVANYASPGLTKCTQGEILLESTYYSVAYQASTPAQYEAALYHNALAVDEGGSATNDGGLKLEKTPYPFLVKTGTYTANGGTYTVNGDVVIASQYHANSLINRHGVLNAKRISLCAFTLGDSVAFVTVPFEASDRYSMSATLATANNYNDWDNLINSEKWGTPFVMSLTNGAEGYIPNNLAYTYTQDLEAKTIAGTIAQHFVSGSYEAHTAYAAAGQGEAIVATLNTLLRGLDNTKAPEVKFGYCEACQAMAKWTPLNDKTVEDNGASLATGHYYLAEDYTTIFGAAMVYLNETVCLDLNGHTYYSKTNTGASRVFRLYGTLNVMDSVGTGVMQGKMSGGGNGGTILVDAPGTLNLYSGTLTCDTTGTGTVANGGVVYVGDNAFFNMYGGTVTGGNASSYGGNVSSQHGGDVGGTFNMYGGTITGGMIKGKTDATYANLMVSGHSFFRYIGGYIPSGAFMQGTMYLGSQEGYIADTSETTAVSIRNSGTVTLDGVFTGKVKLDYSGTKNAAYVTKPTNGSTIGGVTAGSRIDYASGAKITAQVNTSYEGVVSGELLKLGKRPVATVAGVEHTSVASALSASTQANPAVLLGNVTTAVSLSKDGYLDLNGFTLSSVTANGYKLYCMDSKTDDYSVADGKFGTVPASSNVQAMEGYLAYTENNKTSFHKYSMAITDLVVNTQKAGLAYKANFLGDEKVKALVAEFGVAMNIGEAPSAETIQKDTENKTRVVLPQTDWQTGEANGVKSVYVKNILTATSDAAANQYRADLQIYGTCYIKLTDGTLLLGKAENRSLHTALKDMNDYFGNLSADDQSALKSFCAAWSDVMKDWTDIGNLK